MKEIAIFDRTPFKYYIYILFEMIVGIVIDSNFFLFFLLCINRTNFACRIFLPEYRLYWIDLVVGKSLQLLFTKSNRQNRE